MLLYYIRHGDPIYDPDSLTALGKRQAEAVGKRLALHGVDEIYSSSSRRAKETATPLSEILKMPVTELPWCHENLVWQELSDTKEDGTVTWIFWIEKYRKMFRTKEVLQAGQQWYKNPFFEPRIGQGIERVNREADQFLKSFGYEHDRECGTYRVTEKCEKRIALFAHQGFSMAFLSSILDIPYPLFSTHFDITHTGVSVIHFPAEVGADIVPVMWEHSNDSHLYKEGLPTKYNNSLYL